MKKRMNEKSSIVQKFQHEMFLILVRMQFLFIKCKIKPNEINLILAKFLVFLNSIQEITLISQSQTVDEFSNIFKLLDKHSMNFVNFNYNSGVFILLSLFQIIFMFMRFIVYYVTDTKMTQITFQYFVIIHHTILLIPLINLCIHFLNSGYIIFPLFILMLTMIQEIEFCFFNIQNSLIEIEMCYSKRLLSFIYFISYLIICSDNPMFSQYYISKIILLFCKCIQLLTMLHNYHFNTKFSQQSILLVISYLVTQLVKQNWSFTLTAYLLFSQLCHQIRQRKTLIELVDQGEIANLFKYSILENAEFFNCFEQLFTILQSNQREKMKKYQTEMIKNGKFEERLFIILKVFRYKKIQLYLNLINIQKETLTCYQRVLVEANLINVIQQCQDIIKAPPHTDIYIKSLEVEESNLKSLIDLIDQKIKFYKFLMTEIPIQQYLETLRIQTDKIIKKTMKTKKIFDQQYSIAELRLRRFNQSDQATTNILKSFFATFYGNYFKVEDIAAKEKNLLIYDKAMNDKILKNEAILISISYIQNQFQIINKGNKRLMSNTGLHEEPDKITEILPSFQISFYGDLISQYIYQGFEISQPTRIYFEVNSFLQEYELYLYSTISNEDIILHNYFAQKTAPNNFILFDDIGRILGINKDIYNYFTQKSENSFTSALQINQFLAQGMIQYYVPDIYSYLFELINIIQLEKEFKNSITISSRWQFPINHKKCLEFTNQLGLLSSDAITPNRFRKIFYASSIKSVVTKKKSVNDLIPTLKNIKVTMLEQTLMKQVQKIIVPSSRLKSKEFQGVLEFNDFKFVQSEYHHFRLKFNEIEEFKCDNSQQVIHNVPLMNNDAQYEGLLIDYDFFGNCINSPQFFTLLKQDLVLVGLMIIVSFLSLVFDYNSNAQATLFFQESIDFLQCPQAMTFCIAEPFLLNWFNYCKENQLYDLSPFIEYQIKNTFVDTFLYCDSVQLMYSLNLSQKNTFLQSDLFNMTYSNVDQNETIDMFELYLVILEQISNQYRSFSVGQSNPDYTIYKSNGIIRQNLISLFEFHNKVLNSIIENTIQQFAVLQQSNYMILVYQSIGICILLLIFTWTNYRMMKCRVKIVKLLRFFNKKLINDHLELLHKQKEILLNRFTNRYENCIILPCQNNSESIIQSEHKGTKLRKIKQYKEKSIFLFALSFAIGIYLIAFTFGSQLVADLHSLPYQDSLIMTMRYLKLKNNLDQAIIIGELIKTEQYIPENNFSFINQTQSITFFNSAIDELLILANQILNELAITNSYNSTFQQRLINIFDSNICNIYPNYLIFCNVSQIPLEHYPNDDYSDFVENGVYGIIQEINKLRNQEYHYEITYNTYKYNQTLSLKFLHSQIHSNIFISIYLDIEKSIYYSFVDLFNETQLLSEVLLLKIFIYLLVSSIIFISITIVISGFWIKYQYERMNQVKMIITLLPPSLLQQKGFKNLLYLYLIKMK